MQTGGCKILAKLHYWSLKFTLLVQFAPQVSCEHYWSLKFKKLAVLVLFLTIVTVIAYMANGSYETIMWHLFFLIDVTFLFIKKKKNRFTRTHFLIN